MSAIKNIFPLFFLWIFLEVISSFLAGTNAIGFFREDRWLFVLYFCCAVYFFVLLIFLPLSILKCKYYINPETKEINVFLLWMDFFKSINPLSGIFIFCFLTLSTTSIANFVWFYREVSSVWHDNILFSLEENIIKSISLISRYFDIKFFDKVYQCLWLSIFIAFSLIHVFKPSEYLLHVATTIVIAAVNARLIGILFPTAGPIFYRPELFHVSGTVSEFWQNELKLFMTYKIKPHFLYPGTMAMPSLHVGLAYLVVAVSFQLYPLSLLITLPFLILTWLSTVLLGWHYIVDGIGGILVMELSSFFSRKYLLVFKNIIENFDLSKLKRINYKP